MGGGLRVLFPVDIEESTEVLLPAGKELTKIGVEEIQLLHVIHPVDALADPHALDKRKEIIRHYKKILLDQGVPHVRGEVVIGTPWIEITARSQSPDIAFILMGSQGKGFLQRIFLGSQAENVLYHTDRSLFILR
ncbi:MAG: universal stress protein, partial [Methanomicrobiales archaeon]|nr:universal stress protein [Methanomicrobiales archaeon]